MNAERPVDTECLFCRIIAGELPSNIRFESDDVIAFDDIHPKAPTHVLICPKGHYPTFLETPEDVLSQVNAGIKQVSEALGLSERGFRLVVNNGTESGQIVFHLHYHLLAGKPLGGF